LSDMVGLWKVAHTGTPSRMYASLVLLHDGSNGAVILINGEADDARTALMQATLNRFTAQTANHAVLYYARRIDQGVARRRSAGHVRPPMPDRQPVNPAASGGNAGIWRDAWFGDVQLCPREGALRFTSLKSPQMIGQVMHGGQRWFV